VPDCPRIGWPGEKHHGFIEACLQRVLYLKQLGHDVVESTAPDGDVEAYEAGIGTLDLEKHRAGLGTWDGAAYTPGETPAAAFVREITALSAPQRRDLCAARPVDRTTPPRAPPPPDSAGRAQGERRGGRSDLTPRCQAALVVEPVRARV
jgi:hypothetical protein